ncbi:hypothetical protein ACSFA8_01195 [Variovorax sp. RT4R15]|uniref:hypothetical protein n=1 Tax=Variovorax sp. RT4R15 TaxID=3443737 RepID=UPI003F481DBC
MDLDFHVHKIDALTPKAAKIALRMLDGDPRIPTEWIMALRPALVGRSVDSEGFRSTDWMTMAAIERPTIRRFAERFENQEQRHARLWVLSLRQASQQVLRRGPESA